MKAEGEEEARSRVEASWAEVLGGGLMVQRTRAILPSKEIEGTSSCWMEDEVHDG